MYHILEAAFKSVMQYGVMAMEFVGLVVVIQTGVVCFAGYLRGDGQIRIRLAEGISTALLFKMGGEVLRTVIVRTWDELAILGAIIVLRGMLTFLLHWEIRSDKRENALEEEHRQHEKEEQGGAQPGSPA